VEILSLWRSPLDNIALAEATALCERQPRSQIGFGEDFHLMTIYNYGYYLQSATYDTALTTMLLAMTNATPRGGLAFIPQQNFPVDSQLAPGGYSVPYQCNIIASGGGGLASGSASSFYHFSIQGTGPQGDEGNVFFNCSNPAHTTGGQYFRSLAFQWVGSTNPTDACIVSYDTINCRAINCTFTDCPLVMDTSKRLGGSNPALSATLEQCTIQYTQGPANATSIILAGAQCGVIGPCELSQTSRHSGGPIGCTCITIQGPCEHAVIADAYIYEWALGIDFSQKPGAVYTNITNCEVQCWQTALNIKLPTGATTTAGIKVIGCTLAKTSDSNDPSPVVVIDANGSGNSTLNDVSLVDCTVANLALIPLTSGPYGLSIGEGSNIKIIGGTYSNNGPQGGAGIAITGPCSDVQIIGANLHPSYPGATNVNNQQYALLVSGSPSGPVLVSGCDMTGYSGSGPVHVTGTPSELIITNCPGYNDQSTPLNHGVAPLAPGVSAAKCTTPYFGPSVFTYSNAQPVTLEVFGQAITASYGVIFLPSPYDNFYFTEPPSSFSWIGK
jgi:hypothetical protein